MSRNAVKFLAGILAQEFCVIMSLLHPSLLCYGWLTFKKGIVTLGHAGGRDIVSIIWRLYR
jgi:hypothetical protein